MSSKSIDLRVGGELWVYILSRHLLTLLRPPLIRDRKFLSRTCSAKVVCVAFNPLIRKAKP